MANPFDPANLVHAVQNAIAAALATPARVGVKQTRTVAPTKLGTAVQLTVGQLLYHDINGKPQQCAFQFNPTEVERSRSISYTRSRTGNIIEERHVGGRDAAKRKQTRKPDPWEMSLSLRFDAAYGAGIGTVPSPLPDTTAKAATPGADEPTEPKEPYNRVNATYERELERIEDTIRFFEQLAENKPFISENEKVANADETPPPPYMLLALGKRMWQCAAKSVRIKEEDYTPDLRPRRFEVTLSLEVIETTLQNEQGKGPLK